MKKLEFINELGGALSVLPPEEVRPILDYYMEIIADRMEDGLTEEAAISSLGPIDELAKKLLAEHEAESADLQPAASEPFSSPEPVSAEAAPSPRRFSGWALALAIVLSPLWLALFCALIGVEITVWVTLGSLAVAAGAMILGGVSGAVISLIAVLNPLSLYGRIFISGMCLLCAGLGFLLLPFTVWLVRLFARLHRWCFRKLTGKE